MHYPCFSNSSTSITKKLVHLTNFIQTRYKIMRRIYCILLILVTASSAMSQTDTTAADSSLDTKPHWLYQDTVIQQIRISNETLANDTAKLRPIKPFIFMNGYNPEDVLPYMRPEARIVRSAVQDTTLKDSLSTKAVTKTPAETKDDIETKPSKETIAPIVEEKTEEVKTPQKETPAPKAKRYKIQVGALKKESPALVETLQKIVGSNIPIEYEDDNGMKKIMVGNFESYDKADKFKKLLNQSGFSGAFVVTYIDGTRMAK